MHNLSAAAALASGASGRAGERGMAGSGVVACGAGTAQAEAAFLGAVGTALAAATQVAGGKAELPQLAAGAAAGARHGDRAD